MIRCTRTILCSAGALLSVVAMLASGAAAAADPSAFVSVRTDYDAAARSATLYLMNVGKQAIIGGAVVVTFKYSDGSSTTGGARFDLLPSTGLEDKFPAQYRSSEVHIGALRPGETYRFLQGPAPMAQGVVVTSADGQATALVFMDNTAVGDSGEIDSLFETWREVGTTLAAWNKRAGELLVPGAGVGALQQLSGETKATLSRHPATEARIRFKVPAAEDEARARHSPTLEEMDRLVDQNRVAIDAHRVSEAEALSTLKEYLRIRTETAAAHAYRKGSD